MSHHTYLHLSPKHSVADVARMRFLTLLLVLAVIGSIAAFDCWTKKGWLTIVWRHVEDLSVPIKLKIIVSFYQIVIQLETVYQLYLPADVRALLASIQVIISLGIEAVPLVCVGAKGYLGRLIFWMLVPLVLVIIAALGIAGRLLLSCRIAKHKSEIIEMMC